MTTISERNVCLDSKDRNRGTFWDYTIDWNVSDSWFSLKPNERMYVMPTRFSQLNDSNNIGGYNNTFKINYTNLSTLVEGSFNVVFDNGIYDTYTAQIEFQEKIQSAISTEFPSYTFTTTITFDDTTSKYTYLIEEATTFFTDYEITFDFVDADTTPALIMGFADGEYLASSTTSTSATFLSYQPANTIFQPEINVHCNLVTDTYETSSEGVKLSSLLFAINQSAKNDYIVFENPAELFKVPCAIPFSQIRIRMLDYLGREILFQSNSRLTLTFIKETTEAPDTRMTESLEKLISLTQLQLLNQQVNMLK